MIITKMVITSFAEITKIVIYVTQFNANDLKCLQKG